MSSEEQHFMTPSFFPDGMANNLKRRRTSDDFAMEPPESKRPFVPSHRFSIEDSDNGHSAVNPENGENEDKEMAESNSESKWPIPDENQRVRMYELQALSLHNSAAIVHSSWKRLRSHIRIFVYNNLPKAYLWDSIPMQYQEEIKVWASHPKYHIETVEGTHAKCFFEAWVFRLLYDHLFSPTCQDKWASQEWQAYGHLQSRFHEFIDSGNISGHSKNFFNTDFRLWREFSAKMLLDMPESNWHSQPSRLRDILMARLKPLIFSGHKVYPDKLEENIYDLVHKAIELDAYMIYSDYSLIFEMRDPNTNKIKDFPYYPEDEGVIGDFYDYKRMGYQMADYIRFPSFNIYEHQLQCEDDPHLHIVPPYGFYSKTRKEFSKLNVVLNGKGKE